MKYLVLFSLSFFLFISNPALSQTQNSNSVDPPVRAMANFNAKYPDYNGPTKWKETNEGYQATIRQNNNEVEIYFDNDGRWVRSRTEVKENDLPKPVRQYISDSYKPFEYQSGYRYDTKNASRYEVDIRSQNNDYRLEFDKSGGFVKESKAGEGN